MKARLSVDKNKNPKSRAAYPYLVTVVEVEGAKYPMLTPQLAGIAANELGQTVGNLSDHRDEIVAAVDFLITGG